MLGLLLLRRRERSEDIRKATAEAHEEGLGWRLGRGRADGDRDEAGFDGDGDGD